MRSPEIAKQVTALMDDLTEEGSYRLSLDGSGHIVWSFGEGDAVRTWHTDPERRLCNAFPWSCSPRSRRRSCSRRGRPYGVMRNVAR